MPSATPYREAGPVREPAAASELFCPWGDAEAGRGSYVKFVASILAGMAVASVCVAILGPWGLAVAGVAILAILRVQRTRPPVGVSVRVERNVLVLPEARVPLDELLNVEIDSKAIQRITMQQPLGAPMLTSVVGPSLDAGRLVFVFLDGEEERRAVLTETYAPHFHCVEWLGKVRVFLRTHGWVPEDEWDDAAPEASARPSSGEQA